MINAVPPPDITPASPYDLTDWEARDLAKSYIDLVEGLFASMRDCQDHYAVIWWNGHAIEHSGHVKVTETWEVDE